MRRILPACMHFPHRHAAPRIHTMAKLATTTKRLLHASAQAAYAGKPLPPRPKLMDTEITENFLKGTGPGGQKINKTNSSVQLIHHPTGIVIKCQETRSRTQNRKIARQHLAERLELLEKGDESRVAQKAERAKKKKASASKKSRRKYRRLEEAKDEAALHGADDDASPTQDTPDVADDASSSQLTDPVKNDSRPVGNT